MNIVKIGKFKYNEKICQFIKKKTNKKKIRTTKKKSKKLIMKKNYLKIIPGENKHYEDR